MKKKFILSVAALLAAAVLMTGCASGNNGGNEAENSSSSASTEVVTDDMPVAEQTTRALKEGDDYAINKINPKTEGEELPGGYKLIEANELFQGKVYMNGKSQVVIRAHNYRDDFQDLAVWAEDACATMTIGNFTKYCDTVFEEPVSTKMCGYDAVSYDYQVIQYEFIEDENNPGAEPVKSEMHRFNGRNYFFYSGQDAYLVYFETLEDDWEEQIKLGEELMADLAVTEIDY